MSIIIDAYKKNFLVRYDFDLSIPYYTLSDFKNLQGIEEQFLNDNNVEIHYFTYFYEPIKKEKIILFLPGIGPGHRAYFREINEIAKKGYKVISIDYSGCGNSKGDKLPSINEPTKDVISLLKHLNLKEEIVIVGHSLGAYTGLNVINKVNNIHQAVIMSGFLNIKYGMLKFVKSHFIASRIANYENLHNKILDISNLTYLKNTNDKILFIHSKDDATVGYKYMIPKIEKLNNPNLSFLTLNNKKHHPTYTNDAVKYKEAIIDTYFVKSNKGDFKSKEERDAYFKDVSIDKLTNQDEVIFNKIISFIN